MEKDNKNKPDANGEKYEKKTYAYIAIALAAVGAVALGVSFTVLGIYALISSMLFEIAAMTFVNPLCRRSFNIRRRNGMVG